MIAASLRPVLTKEIFRNIVHFGPGGCEVLIEAGERGKGGMEEGSAVQWAVWCVVHIDVVDALWKIADWMRRRLLEYCLSLNWRGGQHVTTH